MTLILVLTASQGLTCYFRRNWELYKQHDTPGLAVDRQLAVNFTMMMCMD
jgi:hypothetical protein